MNDKKKNNENHDDNEADKPVPPGAPDRTPVEDPSKGKYPEVKDPQPPSKKKPRLK